MSDDRRHAPETIETPRLRLRRPRATDVEAIFRRYASDPEVTRLLGWPRHEHVDQTRAFVAFSDAEWARAPAGAYLIESREDGRLLGSTGLQFEGPTIASTGYVLARDAWGQGYASEALRAMIELAASLGVARLYALCHHTHHTSARVLEKGGFALEGRKPAAFPNLGPEAEEALVYGRGLEPGGSGLGAGGERLEARG